MISNVTVNRAQNTNFGAIKVSEKQAAPFVRQGLIIGDTNDVRHLLDTVREWLPRHLTEEDCTKATWRTPELEAIKEVEQLQKTLKKNKINILLNKQEQADSFEAYSTEKQTSNPTFKKLRTLLRSCAENAKPISDDTAIYASETITHLDKLKDGIKAQKEAALARLLGDA